MSDDEYRETIDRAAEDAAAAEESRLLEPGDVVAGRYEIVEPLGVGGMGAVYRAIQRGLQREVALKIILPERRQRAQARERFLREARVASMLRHPGVVTIHDFGEDEHGLYLSMELLNGPSLRAFVDEGLPPLPLSRVCAIASSIADVLATAAQVQLVHRDLKPENVILHREPDGSERVVVVDFGLAFVAEGGDDVRRMTREGVLAGTIDYMSPEQCRGTLDLGPPSDVYTLGVMLYEMLSGTVPFAGDVALMLSRHLFVQPKPLHVVLQAQGRDVPSVLDELVLRMLAKEPADRPTAAQARDRLKQCDASVSGRMGPHGARPGSGRAARMISRGGSAFPPPPTSAQSTLRVGWVGPVDEGLELALAANGIELVDPAEGEVIFIADRAAESPEGYDRPVVVCAKTADVAVLTELLRSGAKDVFVEGSGAEVLATKLLRAVRR